MVEVEAFGGKPSERFEQSRHLVARDHRAAVAHDQPRRTGQRLDDNPTPRRVVLDSVLHQLGDEPFQAGLFAVDGDRYQPMFQDDPGFGCGAGERLRQDGFIAGKTGSDDAAGGCPVFRAIRTVDGKQVPITGVVLGVRGLRPVPAALRAAQRLADAAADSKLIRLAACVKPVGPVRQ